MASLDREVFTRAQAEAAGYAAANIRRLLAQGVWAQLRPAVLVTAAALLQADSDPAARHRLLLAGAVTAGGGDTRVSHESAALVHGLPLLGRPPVLPLVTRPKAPGRTPDRSPHCRTYVAGLPPEHCCDKDGLPVTTPARTAVDIARRRSFRGGVATTDAALRAGLSRADLDAVLRYCAGWPGVRRARDAVRFADELAESVLESVARVAFHEMGLPPPRLQVNLGGDGPIGRVDFYWDDFRTVAEADGRSKYSTPDDIWHEKLREDALRDLGLEVIRVTWADVTRRRDELHARILRAFARAARHSAA